MEPVATLLAALALVTAPPFTAELSAPTHTPKANTRWYWTLRVTDAARRPVAARITAHVVDPFGGVHPVEFGPTTRKIVDFPIRGSFRDYAIWPGASKGFKLTFRVTVTARGVTRRVEYWVRPR